MQTNLFSGRTMILASMHRKEEAMADLLEKHLNVKVKVVENLNTDIFGTFSGEIERKDTPLETLKQKILKGMELSGADLGIGSEGSFVPHPSFPWVNADIESVMLIDQKNDILLEATEIATETNFDRKKVEKWHDVETFARKAYFPSHALILKVENKDGKILAVEKGIQDEKKLREVFEDFSKKGILIVETDMRAMYNPMRMEVIRKATQKLLDKVLSTCPQCGWIGFVVSEVEEGLPCEWCSQPTSLPLKEIKRCVKCGFQEEKWFPQATMFASPSYCSYCNP